MGPTGHRADPIDILIEQGNSRIEELLPIQYARMSTDPFVMAADLSLPRRQVFEYRPAATPSKAYFAKTHLCLSKHALHVEKASTAYERRCKRTVACAIKAGRITASEPRRTKYLIAVDRVSKHNWTALSPKILRGLAISSRS